MSRWTSALNQAAAELPHINGAHFVDLDFVSGHVRYTDADVNIEWGGFTWYGVGEWGTFNGGEESAEIIARGMSLALSGVNEDLLAAINSERYQRRPAIMYVGLFNEDGSLVDTPEVMWSGVIDTMNPEVEYFPNDESAAVIPVECEHRLRQAPPFARWANGDQNARSPGDRFFDMAHFVPTHRSTWGGQPTTFGRKPNGGYGPG